MQCSTFLGKPRFLGHSSWELLRADANALTRYRAGFGGFGSIVRAVAQLMAEKGYRLAVIARDLEVAKTTAVDPVLLQAGVVHLCGCSLCALSPLVCKMSGTGLSGGHLAFRCDVAKEHDVQNTFEEIEKNLGPVNFLVNSAGINRDSLLVRTKTEDMLSQLHTNLVGSMLTCKAAMKTMIQQQRGSIVNVGSIVGLKGNAGQCVYSASKGGLVGFSRALAKEVARKKIRVNVVAAGHKSLIISLREQHQTLQRGFHTRRGHFVTNSRIGDATCHWFSPKRQENVTVATVTTQESCSRNLESHFWTFSPGKRRHCVATMHHENLSLFRVALEAPSVFLVCRTRQTVPHFPLPGTQQTF
ncbi:3-oxoacyl-[acyl-carrier-protein] reductase-like [Glossophaga mutica]